MRYAQYDHASAVLPVTQQKCPKIAKTFLISLVYLCTLFYDSWQDNCSGYRNKLGCVLSINTEFTLKD